MRVNIGPIKGTRGASLEVDFEEKLPSPWDDAHVIVEPVRVRASVTNSGRFYLVRGEIKTAAAAACDRCLEAITLPISLEFEEEFRPRGRAPAALEEGEEPGHEDPAEGDGEEENTFDGDAIDLDDVVREYLVLALPAKVTCREECAGICPHCGGNRNQVACDCEERSVDPRLAGLMDFFERNGR